MSKRPYLVSVAAGVPPLLLHVFSWPFRIDARYWRPVRRSVPKERCLSWSKRSPWPPVGGTAALAGAKLSGQAAKQDASPPFVRFVTFCSQPPSAIGYAGRTNQLSDGGHEGRRLEPQRDAAVRCNALGPQYQSVALPISCSRKLNALAYAPAGRASPSAEMPLFSCSKHLWGVP